MPRKARAAVSVSRRTSLKQELPGPLLSILLTPNLGGIRSRINKLWKEDMKTKEKEEKALGMEGPPLQQAVHSKSVLPEGAEKHLTFE